MFKIVSEKFVFKKQNFKTSIFIFFQNLEPCRVVDDRKLVSGHSFFYIQKQDYFLLIYFYKITRFY